jgi:hypothetical protein
MLTCRHLPQLREQEPQNEQKLPAFSTSIRDGGSAPYQWRFRFGL